MKELLKGMSLREKIAQTAMPSPSATRQGVLEEGSYANYMKKYPFCGFYVVRIGMIKDDGSPVEKGADTAKIVSEASAAAKIPLLIATDAEFGAKQIYADMTDIPSNMATGAAASPELTYKRAYYWAKELYSAGINWAFGPVCDLLKHFLSVSGTRCMSDKTELIVDLIPHAIKGIQDAGVLATAKHYPVTIGDFRDSHFSLVVDELPREEWDKKIKPIWEAAAKAGVDSFMVGHHAHTNLDDSYTSQNMPRPASASKKILDILRKDIDFDGIIVTDAVTMKSVASSFTHEEMYIECLNAGNDVVLFTGNDYIDIIEKAVNDGKVSLERIEEAAERVLRYKKKIGLFEGKYVGEAMTEKDKKDFNETNYEICKKAATLIGNDGKIPFDVSNVKKATIIPLAPSERFHNEYVKLIQDSLARYGVESDVVSEIRSKTTLKEISETSDLIIYACFISWTEPSGFPGYSQEREMNTLFNSLSYGTEKSVVVSFGHPSVYYNYFYGFHGFINMYGLSNESIDAFVDGIFGKFEFTGKSPVALKPHE